MSATRRRERALVIAERIERWGMRRSDDALRVALARHTAGAAVSAPLAVEAAQTAHGRGAHALAEQFARMAFHDAPTVTSGVLLAYALMYQGRAADADTLLNSLEPIIGGAEDRALVATTQSLNAMHGLIDIERAEEILAHHTPLVEGPWRWEISGPAMGSTCTPAASAPPSSRSTPLSPIRSCPRVRSSPCSSPGSSRCTSAAGPPTR